MAKTSKTSKAKIKPAKKKSMGRQSREAAYLESLDLRSMWESFAMETLKNGSFAFPTVWSYITKFTKVQWQRDFLYWILGPIVTDNPASPYKDFTQFDWLKRRENGHWYASSNTDNLAATLKEKKNALAKLAELGDLNLDIIQDIRNVQQTINREFSAGLFLPNLDPKENAQRVKLFVSLKQDLLNLMQQAQLMFGRVNGVDLQSLNQFFALFAANGNNATMGVASSLNIFPQDMAIGEDKQAGLKSVTAQLIDMVANKANDYQMNLPDKEMTDIVANARKPTLVRK